MAQVFVSCQAAAFATISLPDTGSASSIFNSGRQLGSALGVAVLATVLAAVGTTTQVDGHTVANLAAYHAAFLTAAGIALIAAAIALTIRDADAASTMVRRETTKVPARAPSESPRVAG
jgi:Na+/melibiose symporter-like transporter